MVRQATEDEVGQLQRAHDGVMEDVYASLRKHLGTEDNVAFVLVLPGVHSAAVASAIPQEHVVDIFYNLAGGTVADASRRT